MEIFTPYAHALTALALWPILSIVLGMVATTGKTPDNTCACGNPKRNYDDPAYRRSRAFANAMEMSGPFIAATLAAILAGGDPFWVNTFASVFLASRVVTAAIHIGSTIQPLRSAAWMVGLICVISLVVTAVRAVI